MAAAPEIENLDLPVSSVEVKIWANGGVRRDDLQLGDLLGGKGLSPHSGELAEVMHLHATGVWLVSALREGRRLGEPLSPSEIRAAGRFFTWKGLEVLPLSRLRLVAPGLTTIRAQRWANPTEWYVTSAGVLVYAQNGQWYKGGPSPAVVRLPIGAELYQLASELPR